MRRAAGLAAALLCAACAGGPRRGPARDAAWTDEALVRLWVAAREAGRRRDAEAGEEFWVFRSRAGRNAYRADLETLRGLPAGPVCSELEVHLAAGPRPRGPGLYVLLEPVGQVHRTAAVEIVERGGLPRLVFRRPDLTEAERLRATPDEAVRLATQRRRRAWEALEGDALVREIERVRETLRGQVAAARLAADLDLALPPWEPAPAAILAQLEDRNPTQSRTTLLTYLR